MRVTKYNLLLDEDRHPELVKEETKIYRTESSFRNPQTVVKIFNDLYHADRRTEEYGYLLALDVKGKPLGLFELSHGAVDYSIINTRAVMIRLLLCGASGFILLHNHPSGNMNPSAADINVTRRMQEAASIMGIGFFDHIIIGHEEYYSFMENGLLKKEEEN